MHSRKARLFALILAIGCVMSLAVQTPAVGKGNSILEFGTMAPVTGPFVGNTNPIRGVNGGEIPWMITSGRGELDASGKLEVDVHGLVFAAGPNVGTNTVPNFRAVVSCLTINDGSVAVKNVSTDLFPATSTGDSHIEAQLALPSPCVAPIVFVTSPAGAWFAATGN